MSPLLIGGALGALAMYFLDPQQGRRRRVRTRSRVAHAVEAVQGDVLVDRVRAVLSQVVSHPHAIEVDAEGGHVTVSGPILVHETRALLRAVRRVAGVRAVSDQLTVYSELGDASSLQGGVPRPGERADGMLENSAPAARLAAGGVGVALMLSATRARGLLRAFLGLGGGALLARAATNRRGITVQKTIHIAAPVGRVFDFWTDYQNFPRFTANVREAPAIADRRSRWVMTGPAGVPVQWTAELTHMVPGTLIEWRSVSDSDLRHQGRVRFVDAGDGGTRLSVHLTYVPPAGAFGHAVATLFGADPKSEMDADLLRMKSMIETGRVPHDAARHLPRES